MFLHVEAHFSELANILALGGPPTFDKVDQAVKVCLKAPTTMLRPTEHHEGVLAGEEGVTRVGCEGKLRERG